MTTEAKRQKPAQKPQPASPSRKPPQQSVPWGRAALDYRPGHFIKEYLDQHDQACVSEIYKALAQQIIDLNEERSKSAPPVPSPIRRPNYHSLSTYFHWFLILDLIERTGKTKPAKLDFLQERVFYRLTEKGKGESLAWSDPIAAAHPEFALRNYRTGKQRGAAKKRAAATSRHRSK